MEQPELAKKLADMWQAYAERAERAAAESQFKANKDTVHEQKTKAISS